MQYFVYIVECADKTLYCGTARDVNKRILEHNESMRGAKYTKTRRPVVLKYFETFSSKSAALKREHAIKKLTRKKKVELIN